jgi:hypothetical protein
MIKLSEIKCWKDAMISFTTLLHPKQEKQKEKLYLHKMQYYFLYNMYIVHVVAAPQVISCFFFLSFITNFYIIFIVNSDYKKNMKLE